MSSCLGLYIEPNIIKYAKVSKERDNLKVEAFGIKFYDKIGEAIKQIINGNQFDSSLIIGDIKLIAKIIAVLIQVPILSKTSDNSKSITKITIK